MAVAQKASFRRMVTAGIGLLILLGISEGSIRRMAVAAGQAPAGQAPAESVVADQQSSGQVTYRLLEPKSIPAGAAVRRIVIEAVDSSGRRDQQYKGEVVISGVLSRKPQADYQQPYEPTAVTHTFSAGRLQIERDQLEDRDFSISAQGLQIVADGRTPVTLTVSQFSPWLRLLPPVMAILLAILIADVNVSLLVAAFTGCLLFFGGTNPAAATDMLCTSLQGQIADPDRASVILFTMFLGAMIGLMNDSGGTHAVVTRLTKFAKTRERGQVLTWLMGMLVFFDDYANTMLIGGAMRPLSDRLRISRQKLAFLIDSTAAPVAGLAIVSTWVAFEIDQIAIGLTSVGLLTRPAEVFYQTIPYRIYPILCLAMVGAVAASGKDFGTMLNVERQAIQNPVPLPAGDSPAGQGSIWYAVLPVSCLIGLVVICFVNGVDSYRMLLIASLVSSVLAFVLPWVGRQLSLKECSTSWTGGVASMVPAVIVLTLAWTVSDVCRPDQLDTAGFIISRVSEALRVEFLPCIAFLMAGLIALSIGSSFTTMALLMPLFIPLCLTLLPTGGAGAAAAQDPLFLATVGAILAGAIFGDHCSPISDTTVLSSAAAGCDHLSHVSTQFPYALLAGAFSVLTGYLPIGFGLPWWLALPLGLGLTIGTILVFGRRPTPETIAERSSLAGKSNAENTLP